MMVFKKGLFVDICPRMSRGGCYYYRVTCLLQEAAGPAGKLADRWEFPRHHLKVLGILGEGCFGQVWKCEATNIPGTPSQPTVTSFK